MATKEVTDKFPSEVGEVGRGPGGLMLAGPGAHHFRDCLFKVGPGGASLSGSSKGRYAAWSKYRKAAS